MICNLHNLNKNGDNSIKLSDFISKDPDEFANEIFTDGPIDFIYYSRGDAGNRTRIAIVNYDLYNILIRKEEQQERFPWIQQLLSIDSPLTDNTEFLILIEELDEDALDIDKNWKFKSFFNVSTKINALDSNGRSKFAELVINNTSESNIRIVLNEKIKNKEWKYVTSNWIHFGGGFDGTQEKLDDGLIIEAFNLFRNSEEIDVNVFIDSDKSENVKMILNEICQERKDCMGILDCKIEQVVNNRGSEAQSIVSWRKGLSPYLVNNLNISSDKICLYGNWLEVYDRWNKKYRWIPASGHLAGIWALNDYSSEPWFAPAGLNRAILSDGIRRIAFNPTKAERDLLYKNGINPVTSLAGIGKVVWGQKTLLDSSSSFNRINVRRLFLILEKSISTYAKYFLFEQNDEYTRYQIKSVIEPFLRDVQARRGIYEYMVICDERNNTAARIDRGELWVDILVKPTRAAEFIVLRFTNSSTGASFSELTGSLGLD